jgi:septal ring factor EnvC (AmiA/AmiB activator)
MPDPGDGLTLEGLAQILRDHVTGTAAQFAEERTERRAQDAQLRSGIEELRREIGTVASLIRDLAQIVARHEDDLAEHREQIRQSYARMEQHDARFEAMSRDIRRILDALERRGGDGGRQGN